MVFLPECFDFVSSSRAQAIEMAEGISGNTIQRYQQLAQQLSVWLSLGGFHEKVRDYLNSHKCIQKLKRRFF